MGFVNRRFEESEKRSYKVDGEEISLGRGTIDAERDIRLIDYDDHQLEFGNPGNKYYRFVFDWKGHVIPVALQRVWVKEYSVISWSVYGVFGFVRLPEEIEHMRTEILEDLREAVKVFKFEGWSKYPARTQLRKDLEVRIDF